MTKLLVQGEVILAKDVSEHADEIRSVDQVIPKHVVPGWQIVDAEVPADFTPGDHTYANGEVVRKPMPAITQADKDAKNAAINGWRLAANKSTFTHQGKVIACDELSRGDIDAVASTIALTGAFPADFPGGWKAVDNTYLPLATVADFKAMYASMTAQGTANFNHSQELKAAVLAATTQADLDAIVW